MYSWFIDNYEKTDDKTAFIKIKDLYVNWKESEFFNNMSRSRKSKSTMKHFKQDNIIDNNELKKYYVEDSSRTIDGKNVTIKNCIVGWKIIPEEMKCMLNKNEEE